VYLRLPRPAETFERRASRLHDLATGSPVGEFLEALAHLARAQRKALARIRSLPGARELPASVPLRASAWRRDPDWREALAALVEEMRSAPLPPPAGAALERLARAGPAQMEALADALLLGEGGRPDPALAPFAGAALQVYFTSLASELPVQAIERSSSGCPVCGSAPVAGLVLGDDKLRYLSCSLCASEWHLPRIQCWECRATGGISYLAVEGEPGVKAELCSACRAYLKLFYRERMPAAEPLADDVASLTLDLLAAQEGWARSGVNLFLLGGPEG
jgi:FdhE protein